MKTCAHPDGCLRVDIASFNLCWPHYHRLRRTGSLGGAEVRPYEHRDATCTYAGCSSANYARGWCLKHYSRWQKTGSPTPHAELGDDL